MQLFGSLCREANFAIVILIVSISATELWSQEAITFTKDEIAQVNQAAERQFERQNLVGLAVGVIKHGQVAYCQFYGFEDRKNKVPVSQKTKFRWASISKPVTAVAAMLLVQQGKLDLDKDIRTYVPEFPDKGVKITTRQLLCHQGGIVHYRNGQVKSTRKEYESKHPFESVINAIDKFKESDLVNQPGEKYSYSTHAYILLSAVVERAAKQKFADFVDDNISQPLEMSTFQPDYQWVEIGHRAIGYRQRYGKPIESTDTDVSWKLGGGGFISNVEDLAKFAAGMADKKILSEASFSEMWQAQQTNDGQQTNAGLGCFVSKLNGKLKISHSGSQEKTKTMMVFFPESKSGVVVMSNSEYADPGRVSTAIINALKWP